jgi:hypothetical protein
MQFVRKLTEYFPMLERVPNQSLLEENNLASAERIQATRGDDYLLIYSPAGKAFTVKAGKIKGKHLNGYWYNPTN